MEVAQIEQARHVRGTDRLESLYSSEANGALRLAYVLTGDVHVAQDITHEAFARIGRKIFVLGDPEHQRAYLYRTVVNLCRGRGRKLRRERAALERMQGQVTTTTSSSATNSLAWQAVLSLPPRQRAALYLRYYQDQSEAQTAEFLDCSVSAVKSLVNRGLKELRLRNMRSEQ